MRKTTLSKRNWREMTTWMPTHAPNLWVIRPRSSLSYSRAMHADHPWDVTLTSRLFPSGSLIVAHTTVSSTPHAWTLGDLGLSLTNNWSVAWKPPFLVHLYCWVTEARSLHALPWCRPLLGSPYLWAYRDSGPSCQPPSGPSLRGPTMTLVNARAEDGSVHKPSSLELSTCSANRLWPRPADQRGFMWQDVYSVPKWHSCSCLNQRTHVLNKWLGLNVA